MGTLRVWFAIAVLAVAGCAANPLETGAIRPPADVGAFRRCWPWVAATYCGGDASPACQNTAADVYVDPRVRRGGGEAGLSAARHQWLSQWGCPRSVLEDTSSTVLQTPAAR